MASAARAPSSPTPRQLRSPTPPTADACASRSSARRLRRAPSSTTTGRTATRKAKTNTASARTSPSSRPMATPTSSRWREPIASSVNRRTSSHGTTSCTGPARRRSTPSSSAG
ncbi:hypothetical protein ACP4OV_020143 [Aristida adscensionis]